MRISHCGRAVPTREPSRTRSLRPLSLESLETRVALSATGSALSASLASAMNRSLAVAAEVSSREMASPTPGETNAAQPTSRTANGLRLVLAESTLRPRPSDAAAPVPGSSSLARAEVAELNLSESHLGGSSAASKYCRNDLASLCKVKIDDSVSPIYKLPGVDDGYSFPKRPLPPAKPNPIGGTLQPLPLAGR